MKEEAKEAKAIQFQIPQEEGQLMSKMRLRIAGNLEQIKQLNSQIIESMQNGNMAFRSAWMTAKLKEQIPKDIELPDLYSIPSGKSEIEIQGSIATWKKPAPRPEEVEVAEESGEAVEAENDVDKKGK